MSGSVGPQIAEGRTATIHDYGDGRVVKLLKPGFPGAALRAEADRLAAVAAAGAPAPAFHGIVDVGGRAGLVLDRVDGDLLSDELALDPMRFRQWARTLAEAHAAILVCSTDDLPSRTEVMAERIEATDLDRSVRSAALDILAKAPGGEAVLHGDFHPGNVFVTMSDPMVIDWIDAARGHPSADVARTEWLLTAGETPGEGLNRRVIDRLRKGFVKQYLARVTRRLGVNRKVVDAWRIPTLAARVAEGVESEDAVLRTELRRLVG